MSALANCSYCTNFAECQLIGIGDDDVAIFICATCRDQKIKRDMAISEGHYLKEAKC